MVAPFVVMALPRSRTKWLASYLSYGDWICAHDSLQYMHTLDDIATWFTQPHIGTVETAAAPFWRLLPKDARIAIVRRPVDDVLASLARQGVAGDGVTALVRACDRKLDQIEHRVPGVLSVRFDGLAQESACAALFEHCLGQQHDHKWWRAWRHRNVSGNLAAQVRYAHAYLPRMLKLARAAKQGTLAELHRQHSKRMPMDGFVFQEEDKDVWLADAQPLFRQHLAQTGQDPEGYALKNIPLGRQLAEAGVLLVTTARMNGRLFAYLLSLISPTLDEPGILTAHLLLPFASPDAPGIGKKLQNATIEMLRAKGVAKVFGRAGVRGDGPRLGAMFRRQGFVDDGALYRLDL